MTKLVCLALLALVSSSNAFALVNQFQRDISRSTSPIKTHRIKVSSTATFASDGDEEPYVTPPRDQANLVNQTRYVKSIETLQKEIAKAQGIEYKPPENPPVYVLGRFETPLRIDTAPGLDLTETEFEGVADPDGGLVLITTVTGNAADAGLQALDTIVGVSCKASGFQANVNSCDLPTMATALQTAMTQAMEHNSTEIHLEMNRLIAGYYGAEE